MSGLALIAVAAILALPLAAVAGSAADAKSARRLELCGVPAKYEVISGYRSPGTNAKLRAAGHAVAERSQHMAGHAIDVRSWQE